MKSRFRFAFASLLLAFALVAPVARADETFQFTVLGIDCKECAPPILKALNAIKGVQNAKLDWKKGLATVELPAGFEKAKIKSALDAIGYEAVFPGEAQKDLRPLPPEVVERLDIVSYDGSRKVDVKGVLAPGKVTVLDYWAEWCSPCKYQDARLQHLVMANPKVAVRRVDVGNWDNAAARQATAEFRLGALPYVRVYDAAGKHVGSVTGGSWDRLLELIEKAKARS